MRGIAQGGESTRSSTDRRPPNTTAAAAVLSLSLIFWCLLLHQHPHYPGSFSVVVTLPKNSSGALRSLRSTFSHLPGSPIGSNCVHTHTLPLSSSPAVLPLFASPRFCRRRRRRHQNRQQQPPPLSARGKERKGETASETE